MFEAPRQMRSAAVGAGDLGVGMAPMSQIDLGKIVASLWHGRLRSCFRCWPLGACGRVHYARHRPNTPRSTQILIDPTDLRAVGNDTQQPAQVSDAAADAGRKPGQRADLRYRAAPCRRLARPRTRSGIRPRAVVARQLLGRTAIPGGATLAALNELKRRVKVKRAERTFVVEVDVTSRDPKKAARIANADGAGLSRGTNESSLRCRAPGVAVAVVALEGIEGPGSRLRGKSRSLQGEQQHRRSPTGSLSPNSSSPKSTTSSAPPAPAPRKPRRGSIRSRRCSSPRTRTAHSPRLCNRRPSPHCAANMPK